MWSSIRSAILPRNLWVVLTIGILYLALLSRRWLRHKEQARAFEREWCAFDPGHGAGTAIRDHCFRRRHRSDSSMHIFSTFCSIPC